MCKRSIKKHSPLPAHQAMEREQDTDCPTRQFDDRIENNYMALGCVLHRLKVYYL